MNSLLSNISRFSTCAASSTNSSFKLIVNKDVTTLLTKKTIASTAVSYFDLNSMIEISIKIFIFFSAEPWMSQHFTVNAKIFSNWRSFKIMDSRTSRQRWLIRSLASRVDRSESTARFIARCVNRNACSLGT